MNTGKKWRFWSAYIAMTLGTVAVSAAVLLVVFGSGSRWDGAGGWKELFFVLFPIYLLLVGGLTLAVVAMNYIQIYLPLFVSMSCTRREALRSILTVNVVTDLAVAVVSGVLLTVTQKDAALEMGNMILLCLGGLLGTTAVCLALGVAGRRWGKLGGVLSILFFMGVGGAVGAGVAMSPRALSSGGLGLIVIEKGTDLIRYGAPVFAAGVGLYLAASVFAVLSLRRMEVKL